MRGYDSDAVVYRGRGMMRENFKEERRYVIPPPVSERGGNRVFRIVYAPAIGTKWRSEPGGTTECESARAYVCERMVERKGVRI